MQGQVILIPTTARGQANFKTRQVTKPVLLGGKTIKAAQYGPNGIYFIPYFTRCTPLLPPDARCVAITTGRVDDRTLNPPTLRRDADKSPNMAATLLWHSNTTHLPDQFIFGNVLILSGDADFMASL